MKLSRITRNTIVLAWTVFLFCAALLLPHLDSHTRIHPVAKVIVAILYAVFFLVYPIALARYFNQAWRRLSSVPNRTEYVIWMSLESVGAAGLVGIMIYATFCFAFPHLR